MPSEKTTICQGASRSTRRVEITRPRPATASSSAAQVAATALTGTPSGSRANSPASRTSSIQPPTMKVARSRIAARGGFNCSSA